MDIGIIEKRYNYWLKQCQDVKVKNELLDMKDDQTRKADAFFKELEFGTAGMRGVLGAGTNCLNVYNIRKVTYGIAQYMNKHGMRSAAISYDSRHMSIEFARHTAEVFASNGIKVYISHELMPTPYLSFMVRHLKTDMGVMITASHNPAKYNGYKVYNNEGCQITDAAALEITSYVALVDPFDVSFSGYNTLMQKGLIETVNIEEEYLSKVDGQAITDIDIDIVYTPLNGTGYAVIPKALRRHGAKSVHIVKEQSMPDGSFKTCPYPNPEKYEAMRLAIDEAKQCGAPLIIGTDPDADRMGLGVLHNGEYRLLTGNETGVLLIDYIFSARKSLPANPLVVKTIVSSDLAKAVAQSYGAQVAEVLTGFKYIGEVIGGLEKTGCEERFVFGFEESYGYLAGSYVRDKDAVVASVLAAGMASYYQARGMTIIDRLEQLYKKFGQYVHKTVSKEFSGAQGSADIKRIMGFLRQNGVKSIGGLDVVSVTDYLDNAKTGLPKADVLCFYLSGKSTVIVRPSGTEPLIKIYITACGTPQQNDITVAAVMSDLNILIS